MIIVVLFNPGHFMILVFSTLWEDAAALRRKKRNAREKEYGEEMKENQPLFIGM